MMFNLLKEKIKANPALKQRVLFLMMHPVKTRPRYWLRCFQFLYMKKGKRSVVYRSVRKDITPFNSFVMGDYSVIEDYSIINNAVGDIIIGSKSRLGLSSLVLGPVLVGDNVTIGQHTVLSGLNHDYEDVFEEPSKQKIIRKKITIHNNTWIGANSVVLPGITIGGNSMIGAGSVVTKDIPPYSLAVGNPARVIKQYDIEKRIWVKVHEE